MMSVNNKFKISQRGFTLIELLVVIAIIAILAGMAASSLESVVRNSKTKKAQSGLYSAILLAKTKGGSTNERVAVCPVDDITALPLQCANNWANFAMGAPASNQGWVVYIDRDADGLINNADTVVSIDTFDNRGNIGIIAGNNTQIAFISRGEYIGAINSLTVVNSVAVNQGCIALGPTGTIRRFTC